jgi:hypothetical protein
MKPSNAWLLHAVTTAAVIASRLLLFFIGCWFVCLAAWLAGYVVAVLFKSVISYEISLTFDN